MCLSYLFQFINYWKNKRQKEAVDIIDLVHLNHLPDFLLILLERDANVLEDFRCEEVNPAVNARADERFWFLDVMCHLVRRSVLNDTTVVQGLLPRGLLKTKRKIKLGTFSVQNYLPPHHPNCNTFSNIRCRTFLGTSKKTLAGVKPCFVSEFQNGDTECGKASYRGRRWMTVVVT